MIKFVTANIASGIREAINLAERLAITTFGADSHTIRMIEGVLLRSAFSRSRHLGLGSLVPWTIAASTEFMLSILVSRCRTILFIYLNEWNIDAHLDQVRHDVGRRPRSNAVT